MSAPVLVTGGAGFIGSHLVARLLAAGRDVRVLDDFSTGSKENLRAAASAAREARRAPAPGGGVPLAPEQHVARGSPPPRGAEPTAREAAELTVGRLEVVEGDIRDAGVVGRAAADVGTIFHQAAMRSVPRSVADPLGANDHNVTGTLVVLEAARRAGVRRVVYASSSSVYGDRPELPKREDQPPEPISPYAVSKAAGEQYARVWTRLYGVETVGLRYFNVFGPRQDPASEYAAVIPRFITWALRGEPLEIHGDGTQSRDFTYIDNVVDANLAAAAATAPAAAGEAFNVGCGERVSLLDVAAGIEAILGCPVARRHTARRAGDVPHTLASLEKGARLLRWAPRVDFAEGLRRTVEHFRALEGGQR